MMKAKATMQYVMRTAVQARRYAGIAAICTLGISLGACANMQGDERQRAMPAMPEDRMRSYDDGNVTVYPLQGPIPADPADGAVDGGNIRAPHSSHDDPAVTVYSLDDSAEESRTTTARAAPVEPRSSYESRRGESRTSFEDRARNSNSEDNTPTSLTAGEQDSAGEPDAGYSQPDRTGKVDRRARAQSATSSGGALTDYGQDAGVYTGDNDREQGQTGDTRADSRAPAQAEQQSDNRRLLTGP